MKYKLSVAHYYAPLKLLIKTLLSCLVVFVLLYFLVDCLYPNNYDFGKFYVTGLITSLIVFFLNLRRVVLKEELTVNNECIESVYFGQIFLNDILKYEMRSYRGHSLMIEIKDGRKLSIGPRNNIKKSAREEFETFLQAFEEKVKMINAKR